MLYLREYFKQAILTQCFNSLCMLSFNFRALEDSDAAIELSPEWPKGYFRKGRALTGLKVCCLKFTRETRVQMV